MSDNIVYINADEGINRVMNNYMLYCRLLTKFKTDPNLNEIENALAEGDLERARNVTHALKGVTANLSLAELNKQVTELEAQIKAGSVNADQLALVKDIHAKTLIEADKVITKYV